MSVGYFKFHRRFFSHWLWEEERSFSKAEAWIDLLQFAAFAPTKRIVRTKLLLIAEGELVASLRFLAERWKWGKDTVATFLKMLEGDGMVRREIRQGESIIIICKYRDYAHTGGAVPDTGQTGGRQGPDKLEEVEERKEERVAPPARAVGRAVPMPMPTPVPMPVPMPIPMRNPGQSQAREMMPAENARRTDRVMGWINSMNPSWARRPAFTRMEMEELLGVLRLAEELTDADWRVLRAYMHSRIPEDWGRYWQPDGRGQFVRGISDVLGHSDRWAAECRRRRIQIDMEGGKL